MSLFQKSTPSREERIAKGIKLVWDSLDSHLEDTYNPTYNKVVELEAKKHIGTKAFHKKCVKEYAYLINLLNKLL